MMDSFPGEQPGPLSGPQLPTWEIGQTQEYALAGPSWTREDAKVISFLHKDRILSHSVSAGYEEPIRS